MKIVKAGNIDFSAVGDFKLKLHDRESAGRGRVEDFARKIYYMQYGAHLSTYSSELLALNASEKDVLSCVGINGADKGELFLEQYLDEPVERAISCLLGHSVQRDQVAEVGTLSVVSSGLCRLMMSSLAGFLTGRGKRYIVFTAVKTLRNTFRRLDIPYSCVAEADPKKLKGDSSEWGRYYEASPEVIAIDLELCWASINKVLGSINRERRAGMVKLMNKLFLEGQRLGEGETYKFRVA